MSKIKKFMTGAMLVLSTLGGSGKEANAQTSDSNQYGIVNVDGVLTPEQRAAKERIIKLYRGGAYSSIRIMLVDNPEYIVFLENENEKEYQLASLRRYADDVLQRKIKRQQANSGRH
ncbi:MAG: hypothetical protein FWG80_04075 [Alphaproteobacteria bacterium]|nr:hypothetical protein [Alphaproteobacteria bacterium]